MKYNNGEVLYCKHNNKVVWVCAYITRGDIKPIRNVKPTKVQILPYDINKTKKSNHDNTKVMLIPFDKNDQLDYKKFILVESNAYGSFVNIFDNENECIEFYKDEISKGLKILINIRDLYSIKINELEQILIN